MVAHHADLRSWGNGSIRMRFGTIVERTRSLARDKLHGWRRKFAGCSKSGKCRAGGESKVEQESDSSDDDESRLPGHKTSVSSRSYDGRVMPGVGAVDRSSWTTGGDRWDEVTSRGDGWHGKLKDPLPQGKTQPNIPQVQFPRLSGNFFPQVAPLGDSFNFDGDRNGDDSRIAGDRMELAGPYPRHGSDGGRSKFKYLTPIAYEDIVEARANAKRRRLLRAAREAASSVASVVHSASSRSGTSRDSLPSKQEARPPITVARERADLRIARQGKDEGEEVLRVGDTDIDGESSSLLDADEEDFMDSLLLEA